MHYQVPASLVACGEEVEENASARSRFFVLPALLFERAFLDAPRFHARPLFRVSRAPWRVYTPHAAVLRARTGFSCRHPEAAGAHTVALGVPVGFSAHTYFALDKNLD